MSVIGLEVSPNNELYVAVWKWPYNATYPTETNVYKIKSGNWHQVGSRVDITGHIRPVFKLSKQGLPYLLYKGVSGRLKLKKYVNTWIDIDSSGLDIQVPHVTGCDLSINSKEEPFVSHSDTSLVVKHYINNRWKDISPKLPHHEQNRVADLETRKNVLYMYYMDYIYEYGQSWKRVSDSLKFGINIRITSNGHVKGIFKIGPHGRPFVAGNSTDSVYILTAHSEYLNIPQSEFYHSIKIYPNPSSDILHIDINVAQEIQVALYNLSGEIIIQHTLLNDQNKIDVSHLNAGMYILKVAGEHMNVSRKLIIN